MLATPVNFSRSGDPGCPEMRVDTSSDGHRTTTTLPASSPEEPPPVPNVLIVDDDPDQLGLLTAYFVRAGCTVISVADAEHALALPRDADLDLMVLDLRLPGMDGWELTGRLRSRYPRCPIAITSV